MSFHVSTDVIGVRHREEPKRSHKIVICICPPPQEKNPVGEDVGKWANQSVKKMSEQFQSGLGSLWYLIALKQQTR